MTPIPDVTGWADAATKRLQAAANKVATAPLPTKLAEERLTFANLRDEAGPAIERLTGDGRIDRDRCLYVIALDWDGTAEALYAAYGKAKSRDELHLPQDNHQISDIVYVGSSCATNSRKNTLRSRLRQHLIKAPKGTYALSLAEWTHGLPGGIIVSAWQYPAHWIGANADADARHVVLAVEDWLASKLKPMLGRRGSRH